MQRYRLELRKKATQTINRKEGMSDSNCQHSCPEHSMVLAEGGSRECQLKAQTQLKRVAFGEFPELLMGVLGKCSKNSDRFPSFLPS